MSLVSASIQKNSFKWSSLCSKNRLMIWVKFLIFNQKSCQIFTRPSRTKLTSRRLSNQLSNRLTLIQAPFQGSCQTKTNGFGTSFKKFKFLWVKLFHLCRITKKVGVSIWIYWEWTLMSLHERYRWMTMLGNLIKFRQKFTTLLKRKRLWEKNFQKISRFHFSKSVANKWRNSFHKNTQPCKRTWLEWSVKRPSHNLKLFSTHLQWWNKNWNKILKKFKNWLTLKITLLHYQSRWTEWKFKWLKFLMFTKF